MMVDIHFSPLVMLQLDVQHVQLLGVVNGDVLQDLGEVLLNSIPHIQTKFIPIRKRRTQENKRIIKTG